MDRNTIIFEYNKSVGNAKELESIAADLIKIANQRFDDSLSRLSSAWRGENASQYLKKATELKGNMEKTARDLRYVAQAIRRAAERVKKAELQAVELAEKRKYQ